MVTPATPCAVTICAAPPPPPAWLLLLLQCTSILRATGLVGKGEERSVARERWEGAPTGSQGSREEGTVRPPASKPGRHEAAGGEARGNGGWQGGGA